MKKLLILSILSTSAFASGTLSLSQEVLPLIGDRKQATASLYVEETLAEKTFYSSYTGLRFGDWFSTGHTINYQFTDRLSLGAGPSLNKTFGEPTNLSIAVQGAYKLWE